MQCVFTPETVIQMIIMVKRYSELLRFESYDERLKYLLLNSNIGVETFGAERYFNQSFYRSVEWKRIRDSVIVRDNGCDLGIQELPIRGRIVIHHLNPITLKDIQKGSEKLFDLENLVTCSYETHNIIHYGAKIATIRTGYVERTPNDTSPWKR